MQMIKGSIQIMEERNKTGTFTEGITKEKDLLREFIKEYKQ